MTRSLYSIKHFTFRKLSLNAFYKADRGAHNYWLGKGKVDLRPDHILNLIHYEVCWSKSLLHTIQSQETSLVLAFLWLAYMIYHLRIHAQQDAASLSVAILKKKLRGHVLLGCDNNPVSRFSAILLYISSNSLYVIYLVHFFRYSDLNCLCSYQLMSLRNDPRVVCWSNPLYLMPLYCLATFFWIIDNC